MADAIFTPEQEKWLKDNVASVSQFEKLRDKLKTTMNENTKNTSSRLDVMEKTIDILESDVRAVGGKNVPAPIHKENKEKFPLTMLEW